MKLPSASQILLILALTLVPILVLLSFGEKHVHHGLCGHCMSDHTDSQIRLKLPWWDSSLPLSPRWSNPIEETRWCHDMLPLGHVHNDFTTYTSCRPLFEHRFCGHPDFTLTRVRFHKCYESNPSFREFIQAKLQNGSLDKSKLVEEMSFKNQNDLTSPQAEALLNAFWNRSADEP